MVIKKWGLSSSPTYPAQAPWQYNFMLNGCPSLANLRKFGQQDAELSELLVARGRSQPSNIKLGPNGATVDSGELGEYLGGLRIIGTLEFLQTPDAERLTFEFLNSANLLIRRALGLIAVMRWPERFLDASFWDTVERTKLLATLSVFHPELAARVQSAASPDELAKIQAKLKSGGIWSVFYLPGNAGLVFF